MAAQTNRDESIHLSRLVERDKNHIAYAKPIETRMRSLSCSFSLVHRSGSKLYRAADAYAGSKVVNLACADY